MGSPDASRPEPRISYAGLAQGDPVPGGRGEYRGIETASAAVDDGTYERNGGLRKPGPPPLIIYTPRPIL